MVNEIGMHYTNGFCYVQNKEIEEPDLYNDGIESRLRAGGETLIQHPN